jgi:hypothetical protein
MSCKQFLVKKVNNELVNTKWGKLGGQKQAIETWMTKIKQLWYLVG